MTLNPKQTRFVAEYLIDLNATKAAVRAGYSERTAQEQGSRLLSNVMVSAAVAEGQKALANKAAVTAERIVAELAKLGFSNMQDYVGVQGGEAFVDLSTVNRDQWAAVGELVVDRYTEGRGDDAREVKRTKFKLSDKRAALVDLGKHLGLFTDKVDHKHQLTDENNAPLSPLEIARRVAFLLTAGVEQAGQVTDRSSDDIPARS